MRCYLIVGSAHQLLHDATGQVCCLFCSGVSSSLRCKPRSGIATCRPVQLPGAVNRALCEGLLHHTGACMAAAGCLKHLSHHLNCALSCRSPGAPRSCPGPEQPAGRSWPPAALHQASLQAGGFSGWAGMCSGSELAASSSPVTLVAGHAAPQHRAVTASQHVRSCMAAAQGPINLHAS